jgi:hypothetical protein
MLLRPKFYNCISKSGLLYHWGFLLGCRCHWSRRAVHVDDPKARDLLPPVYGPIYHEGQGSTA